MQKLTWNVFVYDLNQNFMSQFNVFDHGRFRKSVEDAFSASKARAEFEMALKANAMYYFWGKYEWEISIAPLFNATETASQKIDVYMQLQSNWPIFVDYIWNSWSKSERT